MPSGAVDQLDAGTPPAAGTPARRILTIEGLATRRTVAAVCLAFVAMRLLAVDIAGIVTNDSLGYLRRADDPFGAGFVSQGYRQAAYPLLIGVSNLLGDVLGWDHVFGVALVQRGLLVVAVGTVIWALRWWSVPVVVVATSSSFVMHADLLLPEGTLIPACLLLGGLLAAAATARTSSPPLAKLAVIAAATTVALSASIKLQYAALILVAVAVAWLVYRDLLISRRFAITAIGSTAFFVTLLGTVQALENRSELGVFEPVSERARAEWYGAWQAVFGVHPDNRDDPQLAEFYDGGNLYTFLHGIERSEPDYPTRARIIRDRVDDLFAAADTTPRAEQVAALLGAMRAGRLDDIDGILDSVLDAHDGDSMARISFNSQFSTDDGATIVADLNDGANPGVVTTGPLVDFTQGLIADHRGHRGLLAVAALVTMLAGFAVRGRHRLAVASVLAPVVLIAAALSTGYIDNARYLLGPLALMMVGGTLAARAITQHVAKLIEQHR